MENGDVYKNVSIIGYNESNDEIHWYSITNLGETHDHILKWTDDNTFTMMYSGMKDNKPFVENIACKFTKPGIVEFQQTVLVNDIIVSETYGIYVRRK
jgi:hypothetical protein